MSLTRKASSAAKKPIKSPRQDLAAALAERDAELAEARSQNARLFDEVQAHKHDVAEALEQQKATSDVLQVISRSSFDLDSVFRTLVEKAVRLCGATTRHDLSARWRTHAVGGGRRGHGGVRELRARQPDCARPRGGGPGGLALEGRTVHVLDIENDPEYSYGGLSLERYRTIVAVPLMRKGAPVGVFTLWRHNVEAFTPRQIALVETFADQALVAIETRGCSAKRRRLWSSTRPRPKCWAQSANPSPMRRRCSKRSSTPASGYSAARNSASTPSATTRWCGWRLGAARGRRKPGTTSPRSPIA